MLRSHKRLRIERHELDEARLESTLPAIVRDGDDVGLDQALHRDDVELDLLESHAHGGIDARQHARQIVAARDLFESLAVERVEMNVEAAQARRRRAPGRAVRAAPRWWSARCPECPESREAFDQLRQIAPQQRLAAREAQFVDAQRGGHAHETLDLFEGEDLLAWRQTAAPSSGMQ